MFTWHIHCITLIVDFKVRKDEKNMVFYDFTKYNFSVFSIFKQL